MMTSSRMNGGSPGSVESPIFTVKGSTRPGAGEGGFGLVSTGAMGGGVGAMPVARPQSSSPAVRGAGPAFTSNGFAGAATGATGGAGAAGATGGADAPAAGAAGAEGFGCDSSSCRARAFVGSSFSACSNNRRAPS
jgi:hypothetical protein